MTRFFLAAGVAALAIATPAAARPGGHGGGDRPATNQGGGGQRAQVQRSAPQRAQAFERRGGGGGGFAAPRMQRVERAAPRVERAQRFAMQRPARVERQQMRANRVQVQNRMAERQQMRANRVQAQNRMAQRQQVRTNRVQAQNRMAARQQIRANRVQAQNRMAARQQIRTNRALAQNRIANRQQLQANRGLQVQNRIAARDQFRANRQLAVQDRIAARQDLRANRIANADAFRTSRLAALTANPRTRILAPAQAMSFVGTPVSTVRNVVTLAALPPAVSYLYPDTPNYYYQYGDGYLYQVDRSTSLIAALLPLLGGGYMPGQYLPNYYMNSYVPNYYGLNSFYPASYGSGYGYGYDNLCNRYANGVVYQVDCFTGMIEDVVPLYAGGYGVGQMLPSSYGYYNVPYQYRSMYYDTADTGYWYAPGAIYQYDQGTSLITSVAALTSPGFSIGQRLPFGYDAYNVPYAYRATYYDTPTAMYRYNNGYIYQVDPTTQLVSAIVASILT